MIDPQPTPRPTLKEHTARMKFETVGIPLECPECHEVRPTVGKRRFGKVLVESCRECWDTLFSTQFLLEQDNSNTIWYVRYVGDDMPIQRIRANQAEGAAILFIEQKWGFNADPGWDCAQVSKDGQTWTTFKVEMELKPIYSATEQTE